MGRLDRNKKENLTIFMGLLNRQLAKDYGYEGYKSQKFSLAEFLDLVHA